jgi:hypothetical protein
MTTSRAFPRPGRHPPLPYRDNPLQREKFHIVRDFITSPLACWHARTVLRVGLH